MKILNKKNESAESLINKARKNIVRELKNLSNNSSEIYEKFREINPTLEGAIKNYCSIYKKLEVVQGQGLLEEFSVASKNLISAFCFTDAVKDYEFISENFLNIQESPLYKAMEAIFDISLFKEEGKARLFTNIYNMQKTIRKLFEDSFIFYVKPYFYYVNATCGVVLRKTDFKVLDFDLEKYIVSQEGFAYYDGRALHTPFEGLAGLWQDAMYKKQSGNKDSGVIYKYIRFTTEESKEEHGKKVFYMPAHQVIALCWYGINVLKFCIGSGSLLTIDHRDNDSLNNSILNLSLLTRVANTRKAFTGEVGTNFIMFFEVLGLVATPFNYKW